MTRRRGLLLLVSLLALAGLVGAGLASQADRLRPRLEAAALRATGRALALGPLHLRLLPGPALVADGVSLANLPGGSRPQMLTAQRVTAQLGVMALLRGRLALTLVLDAPDLLLERTASGPNWVFTAPTAPTAPAAPAAAPAPAGAPTSAVAAPREAGGLGGGRAWLQAVRVGNGVLTWRYQGGGRPRATVLGVTRATLRQASPDAALRLAAVLTRDGAEVTVLADLPGPAAVSAAPERMLPVRLAVVGPGGARGQAEGSVAARPGAYALTIDAEVPALERLRPLLPHADLPALHDVRLGVRLRGAAGAAPEVAGLTLRVGASDLGPLVPGLRLSGGSLEAAGADGAGGPGAAAGGVPGGAAGAAAGGAGAAGVPGGASARPGAPGAPGVTDAVVQGPVRVALDGALGAAGLHVRGVLGPLPGGLVGADGRVADGRVPVDLSAQLGAATLTLRGVAARVGAALAVSARVPDVAVLPPAARRVLPALRDVALDVRVGTPAAGVVALDGLRVTSPLGDLEGALTLGAAGPGALPGTGVAGLAAPGTGAPASRGLLPGGGKVASVSGTLASGRLDADGLLAAWRARPGAGAGEAAGGATGGGGAGPGSQAGGGAAGGGLAGAPASAGGAGEGASDGGAGAAGAAGSTGAGGTTGAGGSTGAGGTTGAGGAGQRRVIPERVLPFAVLRRGEGELSVSVGELTLGGASWRDLAGHLALHDGRLLAAPLRVTAPEGPVRLRIAATAGGAPAAGVSAAGAAPVAAGTTWAGAGAGAAAAGGMAAGAAPAAGTGGAAPTLAVDLASPGLQLGPLLAALGRAGEAEGSLAVDASLSGSGGDTRALAASLSGHVGLALVDGRVQDALLEQLFGGALRRAGVPVTFTGSTAVKCLALRLDLSGGQGTVRALALDSSRLLLGGGGGLNLGDETLDLALRPSVRVGSGAVGVPVQVSGPWSAPRARVRASLRDLLLGAAASVPDPCPAALLAARGGA